MKMVLGIDLGTTSIGWALVREAEQTDREESSIIKLGVRVVPLSVDEIKNFEKGKSITTNAERRLKRGMRRSLQRYKLRRSVLTDVMKRYGWIDDETLLSEEGNRSTFETYRLRAQAVTGEISLPQFARVLLMINKKRGYKSNRRASPAEEGTAIDGMEVARQLYDEGLTPGQLCLRLADEGKKRMPEFYRSDLQSELDRIWSFQQRYHAGLLTADLKMRITSLAKKATVKIFSGENIDTIDGKGPERRMQIYRWRADALSAPLEPEQLATIVSELNGEIERSGGYLGAISDRSKELFFNRETVGQYLMRQLTQNPHSSLKNRVFYRADYLNEFEILWEKQAQYHPELTPERKLEIRDVIIFYQRRLKSQKGQVAFCEFESCRKTITVDGRPKGKTIGLRVCPKSSPLFQEFKIWQTLNNLKITDSVTGDERVLAPEEKELLFSELNVRDRLTDKEAVRLLSGNRKQYELNYKEIDGNTTRTAFFRVFESMFDDLEESGQTGLPAAQREQRLFTAFRKRGYDTGVLFFDPCADEAPLHCLPFYRLWHLLYSYESDSSVSGQESLIEKITEMCGFSREHAALLAKLSFQMDYGSLSAKAIRRILPFLKAGNDYATSCGYAGYRHSKSSLTREERDIRSLCGRLELLPRNSLRNPVVEKILNQLVHVINGIIDTYGKPDEIRIEMARELKKSAGERQSMTEAMNRSKSDQERISKLLRDKFGIEHPGRNDILRYRLYQELAPRGYKTLYSETYIPEEKLFTNEFDIEHIIPKACFFDDSFSNKTLESRQVNIRKGDQTAASFVRHAYGQEGREAYVNRVNDLYRSGKISRAKYLKLKMTQEDIPDGCIERELRDTQYIARKAIEMLEELVKEVVTTTGSVTARLREDWQLVDVMKELNWDKYDRQGLTEVYENRDGKRVGRIKEWTKRNDHRHHAMDALTVAFTRRSHVQYLNHLSARNDKTGVIYGIEQKELQRDRNNKLRFIAPMPPGRFRSEAKRHLEQLLVSMKAKNKVVTAHVNITKSKTGCNRKTELTPRGQLHNESIYGCQYYYETKMEKVGSAFSAEQIERVASARYRAALLKRLDESGGDAKKAFTGKNSLDKTPLYCDDAHEQTVPPVVKTVSQVRRYTIRKAVDKELNVDKVVDPNIRLLLKQRLSEHGNDPKKAFSNLDEDPVWLNKEKGIAVKRVTITGVANAEVLHFKRDKEGRLFPDRSGNLQPTDFVSLSDNHHTAFYCDASGNIQDRVVSFYEAVSRRTAGIPVIDKSYEADNGWTFLFTLKQNEYVVFPNEESGFDPNETDLLNPDNYVRISPNLYRVQAMSKNFYGNTVIREYKFRHHLETMVQDVSELKGTTYRQYKTLSFVRSVVKVRIDHIGRIVAVGEY